MTARCKKTSAANGGVGVPGRVRPARKRAVLPPAADSRALGILGFGFSRGAKGDSIPPARIARTERQTSPPKNKSVDKKAAPARGKPKAGTAEVDDAQTQLETNDTQ
jgi:hypothetical protein